MSRRVVRVDDPGELPAAVGIAAGAAGSAFTPAVPRGVLAGSRAPRELPIDVSAAPGRAA